MPRKPSAKKAASKAVSGMLTALKFIEPATRETGSVNETHCALGGHWAVATDNLITMAAKIDTDISACPNARRLIAALSKCSDTTQITQLDQNRIAIKSGKFQAYVPCIEPALVLITPPDPPQYDIDEKVIASLSIVGKIAKENAQRMIAASVLLRTGSAVATDGVIMFEHWHGWNLPELVIPKAAISVLEKITKKPVKAGASANSFTVWFDDESFFKTQLYVEPYANVDRVLNIETTQGPIPENFFAALDMLEPLQGESEIVYFTKTGLQTYNAEQTNDGAAYSLEGLPEGMAFNINYLRMFAPHAKTVQFGVMLPGGGGAAFYGDAFRGVLMRMRTPGEAPEQPATQPPPAAQWTPPQPTGAAAGMHPGRRGDMDDEIPF